MRKSPLLTLALGAGLIGALAGCTAATSTSTSTSTPTSAASHAPAPAATPTTPANVGTCIDGNAVVVTSKDTPAAKLTEACDTVNIVGTGGQVELGAVSHLVIEGTKNSVTIQSLKLVDFAGADNSIHYGGTTPTVNANGTTGNTVTATD